MSEYLKSEEFLDLLRSWEKGGMPIIFMPDIIKEKTGLNKCRKLLAKCAPFLCDLEDNDSTLENLIKDIGDYFEHIEIKED